MLAFCYLSSLLIFNWSCGGKPTADLVVKGGKIFTARDTGHFVEALAISDGKILAIGSDSVISAYQIGETRVIDLEGRLLVPGFHDAHLHFWSGAVINSQVNLIGTKSKQQVLDKIRTAANNKAPGEWILGRGWDHELWLEPIFPHHSDLDAVAPRNPVFLKRVDGHAAWVNQQTLDLLQFTQTTPDPVGGKIIKDPASGKPTGILIDAAVDRLQEMVTLPAPAERVNILKQGLIYAKSLGITAITDNSQVDIYENYAELFRNQDLVIRVNFWVYGSENLDSLRTEFSKLNVDERFLNARLVKYFADGSLGSRSAFLSKPYEDDPENFGLPMHPQQELQSMVEKAVQGGWQVGIHAIGDAANTMVLDIYEELQQSYPDYQKRWRMEHAQIVKPEDLSRFEKLQVIASMQPTHCITDMRWAENRIGKRARWGYSWRSMLENNIPLAYGTDWPVEPLDPLIGIYAAVTRQDTLGQPEGGWYPEQCLTVGEAVYAYTAGAAYAVHAEDWQGKLLPGYVADMVILDRDIFELPLQEILNTRVLATYVNGEKVFDSVRTNDE
jgi:predicted amidohydrolase YtcJ